ncbi:MAG TPA: VIT1/CCC1 transporter family protein [Candidatus Kapabacteria bacterium]|jgi:VIT1/CCC1 family predicted Fe2+/Mn2+ transporter|nr:VIT1/CCC1 transporter family protein [Candidatus Kapabacteria bacterium]HOV93105.1 VIT1/CCC1 transporter family protein [Candidatus Kapabacteria bacterium]
MDAALQNKLLKSQKNEITEHYVYAKLANKIKDQKNANILMQISRDELSHYNFWKNYTQKEVPANKFRIYLYVLIAQVFGLTFGIKLMEKGEQKAQISYLELAKLLPGAQSVIDDENNHENELINLIQEERLNYIGAIVLGLNDALVELTGALAGMTFAIQNPQIIALAGLITGIAASFSMAVALYLSERAENSNSKPLKSALYTGISYILTVTLLVLPYLLIANPFISLIFTMIIAIIIILIFSFYVSVAKDLSFKHRFLEMAILNVSVALVTFGIGALVREVFGVVV